jgi:hypothetical protein
MTQDAMRVVLHRSDETVEFQLVEGRWIGDDGSNVTIDAMLPAGAVQRAGNRGLTLAACS